MEIDKKKIDDAILALLFLTLDRDGRAWKGRRPQSCFASRYRFYYIDSIAIEL